MIRTVLVLTALAMPAFGQISKEWLTERQTLLNDLRIETTRFKPQHPQMIHWQELIKVLEDQSKLMQVPRSQWNADAIKKKIEAISFQVDFLKKEISNYMPRHPSLSRKLETISLLEREMESLKD